jgi:thymidylate synthase (FAD)
MGDKLRVLLLAHTNYIHQSIPGYTPHVLEGEHVTISDELAEMAGRLCYLSWERPNPDTATNAGYLSNIIVQRHFSVLEHASATFYIDGVTRNLTHELIRHRHLSFSEVSQRYVNVEDFPVIEHPGLRDLDGLTKLSIANAAVGAKATYKRVFDKLRGKGFERKAARQAARHVLPGGLETRIVVSGNLRAWREMLEKRLSPAADAEFREVAQKILAELKVIAPATFQDFE